MLSSDGGLNRDAGPGAFHAEFTGERVIPGRVEDNLFNEHLARYRFAARVVRQLGIGGAFLDAGCGAGYGAAELAATGAQILAIDISPDAIAHARANYGAASNVRFEQASCITVPAEDGAFRLIAAFEVIEHLSGWREFLLEARRVLEPAGLLLVSTPNRLYYAESRQKAGPNPFHVHEFTEGEFRSELGSIFPHVKVLSQNHIEGIAFSGADAEGAVFEISERPDDPASAHFLLAVCGIEALPPIAGFVFIPETGNVLQTREHHIALLNGEIRQKNEWIETERVQRRLMIDKVRELEAELEDHNRWARQANEEAERRARLVAKLQDELRKSNEWAQARDAEAVERGRRIERLQGEVAQATAWASERNAEAETRGRRVVELQAELAQATEWATHSDTEAESRGRRIVEQQEELQREQESNLAAVQRLEHEMAASSANYEGAIEQWQKAKEAADQWAMETERRLTAERDAAREAFEGKQNEFENALERIASLEADVVQLGAQVTEANAQVTEAKTKMAMIAQSRWVRLGRVVRVGPEINQTSS